MSKMVRLRMEDRAGLWLVAGIAGGTFALRQLAVVRRMTVGLCAAANAPSICAPRAVLLWLQYQQAFGWATLLCGIAGFALGRRWLGMLAVAIGIAAVVNVNATTGIIGAVVSLVSGIGLVGSGDVTAIL